MSYPYRVVVTKGIEETVRAADRSERTLELPPIVARERARQILEAALRRRGWEGEGGKLVRPGGKGEESVLDLETGKVTTTVEEDEVLRKELSLEGVGDSLSRPTAADEEALRRKVEAELDTRLAISEEDRAAKRVALESRLARRLAASDEERAKELEAVLLEVYAESLKEKARSLGTVTEVREETTAAGEYELVIRIEE